MSCTTQTVIIYITAFCVDGRNNAPISLTLTDETVLSSDLRIWWTRSLHQ